MESQIEAIRRKISYAYMLKNCIEKNDYTKRQKYIERRFEKQYGRATKNNLNKVLTDLKHDLKVNSEKLHHKKTIPERKYINRMFKVAPKTVYRGMRDGSQQKVKNMPEQTEVESFWKSIWNVPTQHNTEAPWLEDLKQEYCKNVKAKDYEITDEVLDKVLSKLVNDKPGRDLFPGLWIKRLSSMKEHFKRNLINSFNLDKEIPQWLVLSKTLLLPKNEDTNKANNYRPIALQNSMHKVFTAIITEFIMDHCIVNNLVTEEQAAGRLGSWGCADQLLINKMVSDEVIKNRRNLITVWLDYKKAFDSVPHSWIIESLKLAKIPDKIIDVIKMLMSKWRTKIHLYG